MWHRREPTGNTHLETSVEERIEIREVEKGQPVRSEEIQERVKS